MKGCMICLRKSKILHDGMCKKCLGEGANISLLSAYEDKHNKLIKHIEDKMDQGKIVRII